MTELFTSDLQPAFNFDGKTFDHELDQARLGDQAQRVFDLMKDGEWRTLAEIEAETGDPQSSISARLRDFRKVKCGGHAVNRKRRGEGFSGLFEYQLTPRS